ncbi:MAG: RHS repeat-associated core domain-containing protein [Chloroflexi bacterium]|nr:RHS repeat-associated core domain-containing protein [Chloroflexota bacterium]
MEVYHEDGLGSVRAITDASALVVQTYQTDEFGVATLTQGTDSQPFQYTGEQRDGETGFAYLRARMYDPGLGRFLQRDSFAGLLRNPLSLHRYVYARTNPVNLLDPSGLYEYRYEWYLGQRSIVGTPERVMEYFQQHPREIFPFDLRECGAIQLGAQCDLDAGPGPAKHAPVEITAVSSTSFTFTALERHFDYNPKDPQGSWIRFTIIERGGNIYLQQKARALVEDPRIDFLAPRVAYLTWAQQARNLRRIFNPAYPAEPMPQLGG